MDPRGCRWQRISKADPPGLMDFPNIGVSEPFHEAGRSMDTKQIFTFRTCHGPAMVFEYLFFFVVIFLIYFFVSWIVGGGE